MKDYVSYLIYNDDKKEIVAECYGTKQDVRDLYDKLSKERADNDWDIWSIYERVAR